MVMGPPSKISGSAIAGLADGEITDVSGSVDLSGGAWVLDTPETQLRLDGSIGVSGT